VTEINHAIGAEGVLSVECKEIVTEYGELIWDLLVAGVCCLSMFFFLPWLVVFALSPYAISILEPKWVHLDFQVRPGDVCSQVGLCVSKRDQSKRLESFLFLLK
jgi:phytepsin